MLSQVRKTFLFVRDLCYRSGQNVSIIALKKKCFLSQME
uniref:Uncharacterized protein n=1 Tax=Setaria italica TaxID=4555 RepID=K4A4K8_SETIT